MQHDDIPFFDMYAIQHCRKMVERVIVADGYEDVAGTGAYAFTGEFAARGNVELVHFDVLLPHAADGVQFSRTL